jgi:hypothetical protein
MKGVTAREAVDGFHPVAVEKGNVMIADFHHQKQVHHVGLVSRLIGQSTFWVGQ